MKCRAAVLHEMGAAEPYAESRPIRIEEVELDEPQAGEVLVRIAAAGLCHSDLSVVNGSRPRPLPMVIGHEASGVVERTGPGVSDLAPGDHVVFVFVPSCGSCLPCSEGRPALCEPAAAANAAGTLLNDGRRIRLNGEYVTHHVGVSCFAEYAVVSRCSLVKVPEALPLDHAALFGCAVITGVGAVVNTAAMRMGSTAVVVGLGGTGLAALLGAIAAGARKTVGVDLLDSKLEMARALGCDEVVRADDPEVVDKVKALTGGGGDFAFECVGSEKAMELSYALTRRGGTTVSSGLSHPERKFAIQHVNLVAEERTIKGSYLGSCVPRRDIPDYIELFQAGELPVDKLMSEKISLDEVNEGFDKLAAGETVRQLIWFGD
ncbi:MAG: zinc-dependent alcohol dehydrogenase family protein [Gammaproteobacteria bacterium]